MSRNFLREATLSVMLVTSAGQAATTTFFNSTQTATLAATGTTSETWSSRGYLFTHSLDKWWYPTISLGGGTPTGRFQSVFWPDGLHAQAITAGPNGLLTGQSSAYITIKRVDGRPFDLVSFKAKLLANTAGAGASFEIMPTLQGEDAFPDPLMLDATGYGGMTFSYTTPSLKGYEAYHIALWVDFALTGCVITDDSPTPPPTLFMDLIPSGQARLSWSVDDGACTLQSTADLTSGQFSDVGVTPSLQNGMQVVTLPLTAGNRFFRLLR